MEPCEHITFMYPTDVVGNERFIRIHIRRSASLVIELINLTIKSFQSKVYINNSHEIYFSSFDPNIE